MTLGSVSACVGGWFSGHEHRASHRQPVPAEGRRGTGEGGACQAEQVDGVHRREQPRVLLQLPPQHRAVRVRGPARAAGAGAGASGGGGGGGGDAYTAANFTRPCRGWPAAAGRPSPASSASCATSLWTTGTMTSWRGAAVSRFFFSFACVECSRAYDCVGTMAWAWLHGHGCVPRCVDR
jgi:hypothetical protein